MKKSTTTMNFNLPERELLISKMGRKYLFPLAIMMGIFMLGIVSGIIVALWFPITIAVKVSLSFAILFTVTTTIYIWLRKMIGKQVDAILKSQEEMKKTLSDMFGGFGDALSKLKDRIGSGDGGFIMEFGRNLRDGEELDEDIDEVDLMKITDIKFLKNLLSHAEKNDNFEKAKIISERIKELENHK